MAAQPKTRPTRARDAKSTGVPSIIAIRSGGDKPPLFLIHGVDGTMRPFRRLVKYLDPDQPIYGVLSQAFLDEKIVLTRVEDLALYYVEAIRTLRLQGPCHFLGFSFGGYLALEIAQRLQAQGEQIGMLGMLDNLRMGSVDDSGQPGAIPRALKRRCEQIVMHLGHLLKPDPVHYFKREIRTRILKAAYTLLDARGRPIPRFLRRPIDINWFAATKYTPRFYPGKVTLFQAATSAHLPQSTSRLWAELAGEGVQIVEIPGEHGNILREPHVRSLAKALTECLSDIRGAMPCVGADGRTSQA